MLGLPVKVFMGAKDIERQAMNVERIKMLGAEIISVEEGSKTLKDAVNAAMKYRTNNLDDGYYLL
jgi:tryptophan synthase beta chain